MRQKLYLETSVFGFYFDNSKHNEEKKDSTHLMFDLIKKNVYQGLISNLVVTEINKIPDRYLDRFIKLFNDYNLKIIENNDFEKENIEYLTTLLIKNKIVPEEMTNDALHISDYVFSEANYLISWNCKHIANAKVLREIKSLLLKEGINKNIEIFTPMEVMYG